MKVLFSLINSDVNYSQKHKHSCLEIVYRLCGDSFTTIGNKTYTISKGDVYFIPPETYHFDHSEGTFSDLVIHSDSTDIVNTLVLHDNQTYVKSLSLMINEIINKKEDNYQRITNSLLDALIQYAKRFSSIDTNNLTVELLKNIIFENIENCDFDITKTIEDMGYNVDYMRRRFKAQTHKTPHDYLIDFRIDRAKQLLIINTHESIESISLKCGFSDSFYFSTCFKKHTGFSPLQYRKQNLS